MNKFVKNLKGFTLVEVLIVIVIVGILIAALLPRLQGSQERARDVARKGHVQQLATAYGIYNQDETQYPASACIDSGADVADYMSSVPTDPQSSNTVALDGSTTCTGQYAFIQLDSGDGGLVVSALETPDNGGNFDCSDPNAINNTITGAQAAICGGGSGDCPEGPQWFAVLMR